MHALLKLDRSGKIPLQEQLYTQIQQLIVCGRLRPGTRITATRELAEELHVSRNTVVLALARLTSEAYLVSRPTVGIFVAGHYPQAPDTGRNGQPPADHAAALPAAVLTGERRLRPVAGNPLADPVIDFALSANSSALFPLKAWRHLTQAALRRPPAHQDWAPPPCGLPVLRDEIASWLAYSRGIVVAADQIILTAGRQQAYDIAAQLLVRDGDRVVVEAPCRRGSAKLYRSLGAVLETVPVDVEGIEVNRLPSGRAVLAHLSPAHQSLMGGSLSAHRLADAVAWAERSGAHLLEDDCDAAIRYDGLPPPSLIGQAADRVLHIGSFQDPLGGAVPFAYLVVPRHLVAPAVALKEQLDNGLPWLQQMAMAQFLMSGGYDRHIRQVRKLLLDRRDALVESLHRRFGPLRLAGGQAGLHLAWHLPENLPDAVTAERLLHAAGIRVQALASCALTDGIPARWLERVVLLGFANLSESEIGEGVCRMARALGAAAYGADAGKAEGTKLDDADGQERQRAQA